MFKNKKMQYIIKTCASEDTQALQNLLNEMSMNGWELYTINEVEIEEDEYQYNCIFMKEAEDENYAMNKGTAEIIVAKNKYGTMATIRLLFRSSIMKFLEPESYDVF